MQDTLETNQEPEERKEIDKTDESQVGEAPEYDTHAPSSPIADPGETGNGSDSGVIHTFHFADNYISNDVEECGCGPCRTLSLRRDIVMADGGVPGLDLPSSDIPGTDTDDNTIKVPAQLTSIFKAHYFFRISWSHFRGDQRRDPRFLVP